MMLPKCFNLMMIIPVSRVIRLPDLGWDNTHTTYIYFQGQFARLSMSMYSLCRRMPVISCLRIGLICLVILNLRLHITEGRIVYYLTYWVSIISYLNYTLVDSIELQLQDEFRFMILIVMPLVSCKTWMFYHDVTYLIASIHFYPTLSMYSQS